MILVDVHAHLDFEDFNNDLDKVIENARKAGVKAIIANGVSHETNEKVLKIAEKYDIVKPALGIYPPDALSRETKSDITVDIDQEIEFFEKNSKKVFAIGECGLDYYNGKDKEMQKKILIKQLEFAKKHDIPIIIHSRKAEEDVINLLEEFNYKKVVLHCFSGNKTLIKRGADLGFYFSIPTSVVRSKNIKNVVKIVNINQLLTETDAPFLSPHEDIRRNEPAFVVESVKKIAEIKEFTVEETANNIWLNFQRLFL